MRIKEHKNISQPALCLTHSNVMHLIYCSSLYQIYFFPSSIPMHSWQLKQSVMLHHGKSASCLHIWKLSSPGEPCFPMALLWHESWLFTLMAGTILGEAVTLRSAYNKISLLFQLTWQTPWRTNAYNCQRLVWDLINAVFFQDQFSKAKWRLQSPSANAGTCPSRGHPDTGCYFSATFRKVLSKTKAI